MLSSRNSSNHYYPIEKQKKISSYTKPRTVQHGIPTGTCPNGSTAMANILVHRHQPISQVTTSENVNSHRFSSTLTTTGANYSLGRHQLSSTPRLCFDLYPQKNIRTDMIKLQEQVISLRDLAKNHERTIAQKNKVISDLTDEIKRMKHTMQLNLKVENTKRKDFCTALADRYYKQHILKQAIVEWKQFMECTWKQRNFRRLTLEAQSECIKITKEFNQKILQLETELKVSQSELESVKAKQASEQAALKTALMRGVCALNMETMAVFNETLPNLNRGNEDKKPTFKMTNLKEEQNSTDDPLLLPQFTSKKLDNNFQRDKTMYNQSSENMILNLQTDHTVQSTHQSNTGFHEESRLNPVESWPRDKLNNFESSYCNGGRKDKYGIPLNHSTEICERWLGHQVSDNLVSLPCYDLLMS
ncbi:unnamed protein product [Heterobilharzia americana]|nr:unnamed protein product [Heterobilharzia americana]